MGLSPPKRAPVDASTNALMNTWGGGGPSVSAWGQPEYTTDQNGYRTTGKIDNFGKGNYGLNSSMFQQGRDADARGANAATAENNYTRGLQGGAWAQDPYERAQQQRNFHQTADFKKYWNALDPAAQLQEKMGTEAYDFRKSLPELMARKRDELAHEAGSALGQGLHNERANMAGRGLLNSGMRESQEGGMRAQAANTLAGQMAGSNAELGKMADSRDFSAAQSGLAASREAMQAQQQVDEIHMQNEIRRAQQWQQLAGTAGYAAGRYFGRGGQSGSAAPVGNGLPSDDDYYNGYKSDPYDDYMSGER